MITAEVEPLGGFIGDAIGAAGVPGRLLLVDVIFIFDAGPDARRRRDRALPAAGLS